MCLGLSERSRLTCHIDMLDYIFGVNVVLIVTIVVILIYLPINEVHSNALCIARFDLLKPDHATKTYCDYFTTS